MRGNLLTHVGSNKLDPLSESQYVRGAASTDNENLDTPDEKTTSEISQRTLEDVAKLAQLPKDSGKDSVDTFSPMVDVEGYRNYRGDYVFGAWSWVPQYELGIGSEFYAVDATVPLRNAIYAHGGVLVFLGICLGGVTILRRQHIQKTLLLQRQQSQLAEFFEHAPIGVQLTDEKGRIVRVNGVLTSTSLGNTSEKAGTSSTSSKVKRSSISIGWFPIASLASIIGFDLIYQTNPYLST